jgi:glycosyltransferase involved in cell wall biosynthesis
VLLIHGVHTPFLWFGVLARALRGLVVVPVLTDPPGVAQPGDGAVIRLLRTIDVFLVTSALRRCDGAVALTPALARDFAPDRPWLLMDGILRTPQQVAAASQQPPRRARCTFDVVYAGGLTRAYGVSRLVEAVRGLDDPAVRLLTYGRGELEPWLREQSAEDDRIRPPELLPRSELIRRLVAADVLVNPRPVNQGFVNYSFPSKLIEYLSTGTPVITTRLPAISSEYEGRLLFADPDTVAGLRAAISQVRTMPPEAACALGLAGANLVQSTRSAEAQGTRISCFLSTLLERSEHTGQDREQGKGKPRSRR